MILEDLTTEDVDLLLESLPAWETSHISGELMMGLVGRMATKGNPEEREKMEAEEKARILENDQKKRLRREHSIVLQAKLIRLRDRMKVEAEISR